MFPARHRAVVYTASGPVELDSEDPVEDGRLPVASAVGTWVVEMDPAVDRAGVALALSRRTAGGLQRIDDESSWLTCTVAPDRSVDALLRAYRVIDHLVGSPSDQRRALRTRSIDRLTVKSRDVKVDPARVLRELGCREGSGPVLILTRRGGRMLSLLADAAPERHA